MLTMKPSFFREVTWDEVRPEMQQLAPDLFTAIEQLSPDNSYKLYEVKYPYGERIINEKGHFQIPDQYGKLIPVTDNNFDKKLLEEFQYNFPGTPMGMVMEGETQLFVEEDSRRTSSPVIFSAGDMYGLNRVLDLPKEFQIITYWRMTAGARTPYMLPSISDQVKFNRLTDEFKLDIPPPNDQRDHFLFFKALANHPNFTKPWYARVLLFGKKWIEWQPSVHAKLFRLALFERAWTTSGLSRNAYIIEKFWEKSIKTIRNKKVDRYILSMARHIIEAGCGKIPSYQVADANSSGPFGEIANIICDVYGLKNYAPVIVTPKSFDPPKDKDTYISIQLPTIDLLRQRTSRSHFLLADFREIMYVVNKFINDNHEGLLTKVPVYNIDHFKYQFYAANKGKNNEFLFAENAFDNNKMIDYWKRPGNDKIFSYNTFMRACVRVTYTG